MEQINDPRTPVLVVDDDTGLLASIHAVLVGAGFPEPALLSDGRRVMDLLRTLDIHLVLLDLIMPQVEGLELLRQIKTEFPHVECIIFTAVDDVATAIQAMRFGAYDYLVKSLNNEKLVIVITRALERYSLRHELTLHERKQSFADLKHPEAFRHLVARDEAMALVFRQVEVVAPTDYSVVITGESGTGKEMLARVIHALSSRAAAPFMGVNMAAFSRSIFEDEFFGHAKGAYTNAVGERKGFLESAQGGTLFLDEITELDPGLQSKLLRVIEERELYRLGSTERRNVDVRFIAATNRDIQQEIAAGRFRADLFYRLNHYTIRIPALRERPRDILPLATHFLGIHARKNNRPVRTIAPELAQRLQAYAYPGNVRELQNILAAAVLAAQGEQLTSSHTVHLLPPSAGQPPAANAPPSPASAFLTLEELEKRHIRDVLEACGGNRVEAARILGINPSTVYRKIKSYAI